MKKKGVLAIVSIILLLAASLFGAFVAAGQQTQQEYSGAKWEYMILLYGLFPIPMTAHEENDNYYLQELTRLIQALPEEQIGRAMPIALDFLGSEGWEVVAVDPGGGQMLLKRPLQESPNL